MSPKEREIVKKAQAYVANGYLRQALSMKSCPEEVANKIIQWAMNCGKC